MAKAATAECAGCHYRFEKPSMHKVESYKTTGSSTGFYIGAATGKRKTRNPRFGARTYQRKVTEWYCQDCKKGKRARTRRNRIITSLLVQQSLQNLNDIEKQTFQTEYAKQKKTKGLLIVLAIFFPIQLFILGKIGLGIAFWLTFGGFFFWWFIEIFRTSKRVDEFNDNLAINIIRTIKTPNPKN